MGRPTCEDRCLNGKCWEKEPGANGSRRGRHWGNLGLKLFHQKLKNVNLSAVSRFLSFLISQGKGYPQNFWVLDLEVSAFIEELWEQGDPKGWAGDCLSGLGHFIPACKPSLVGSWRLHSAWGRAELPCCAPPVCTSPPVCSGPVSCQS